MIGIEQRLDPFVAEGSAAEHRDSLQLKRHLPDGPFQFGLRDLLTIDKFLHQKVVSLSQPFDQGFSLPGSLFQIILRNIDDFDNDPQDCGDRRERLSW